MTPVFTPVKLTLNRATLLENIEFVSQALDKRSLDQSERYILVFDTGQVMAASEYAIAIVGQETTLEGRHYFALPGDRFVNLLRLMNGDEVRFALGHGKDPESRTFTVTVSCDRSRYSFAWPPETIMKILSRVKLAMDDATAIANLEAPTDLLRCGLNNVCGFTADKNTTSQYALSFIRVVAEGNSLHLMASDAARAAKSTVPLAVASEKLVFPLPQEAAGLVKQLTGDKISILIGKTCIKLTGQAQTVFLRLPAAQPPDLNKFFDKIALCCKKQIVVSTKLLASAMKRLDAVVTTGRLRRIELEVKRGSDLLTLSAETEEGTFNEEIPLRSNAELESDIKSSLNLSSLLQVISLSRNENLTINFGSSGDAVAMSEENWIAAMMPLMKA